MLFLYRPSRESIDAFLARQADAPFSYAEVGRTRETPPGGYVVDHRRVRLGVGRPVYDAAREALLRWEMFRVGWVQLCWSSTAIAPGTAVAVLARYGPLWWLNACRIVYITDERNSSRCFGFAYGTLLDHVERGEERFTIEWRDDDTVWYDLFAFSQPAHWLARMGRPLARRLQARFARDSLAAMRRVTRDPFIRSPEALENRPQKGGNGFGER